MVNINIGGYEFLPDLVGLTLLFVCAVLFTDRAARFARTAVVAAVMVFLEVVRLFNLAEADSLIMVFGMLYLFLQVLLVITAADGVAQFSQLQGQESISRLCDLTGHIYALTFVCAILGGWFGDLAMVLNLVSYLITAFVIIMFLYFYTVVLTPLEEHELPFFDVFGSLEGLESTEDTEAGADTEAAGIETAEPL
jgi:hypothetical protein